MRVCLTICLNILLASSAAGFIVLPKKIQLSHRTLLAARKDENGANDEHYTYVEGAEYDDIKTEIESLGGDPFFLDEDDEDAEASGSKKTEIESLGGDPFFLDDDEDEMVMPGVMSAIGVEETIERLDPNGEGPSPTNEDSSQEYDDRATEVESIGGDPFFLDKEEEEEDDETLAAGVLSVIGVEDTIERFEGFASAGEGPTPTREENTLDFQDRMSEIEMLGGDPFFLGEGGDDEIEPDSAGTEAAQVESLSSRGVMSVIGEEDAEERFVTDGKGPTPKGTDNTFFDGEMWDGTIDEEAHYDFE